MLLVIADEFVDPSFGTGALKITPAHDVNDYSLGRRHGLPALTVIGKDGSLNEKVREEGTERDAYEAGWAVLWDSLEFLCPSLSPYSFCLCLPLHMSMYILMNADALPLCSGWPAVCRLRPLRGQRAPLGGYAGNDTREAIANSSF